MDRRTFIKDVVVTSVAVFLIPISFAYKKIARFRKIKTFKHSDLEKKHNLAG